MFATQPSCIVTDVRPASPRALASTEPSHIHIPRPSRLAAQRLTESIRELQAAPEQEAA
jgi:hypothetical protein